MPIITARCDQCGKYLKKADLKALTKDARLLCEKCAKQVVPDQILAWR